MKSCRINDTECSEVGGRIRRELCGVHYQRWMKHGDVHAPRTHALTTHGMTRTPTWIVWNGIIQRCINSKNPAFGKYGGRGIRICERWYASFMAFYEDMGSRPEGMSIDRRDNNGNYSCGKCDDCVVNGWTMNCRWTDRTTQQYNRGKQATKNGQPTSSQYIGVCWSNAVSRWRADVRLPGRNKFLGHFDNEEEAARARDAAVIEQGLPATLNFDREMKAVA